MKRPALIWLVFAACTLVGLAVLGWFSGEMLRLERGAGQAREIAAREENVRLALWRMDSALASIHGLEAARPPEEYDPFVAFTDAYTPDLREMRGAVKLPSPLLGFTPPFVRLHLQILADGRITSPQAPEGNARLAALQAHVSSDAINAASARLEALRQGETAAALLAQSPSEAPSVSRRQANAAPRDDEATSRRNLVSDAAEPALAATPAVEPPGPAGASVQELTPQAKEQTTVELKKSRIEQQQRAVLADESYYNVNRPTLSRSRPPTSLASDDESRKDREADTAGEARTSGNVVASDTAAERGESLVRAARAREETTRGTSAPGAPADGLAAPQAAAFAASSAAGQPPAGAIAPKGEAGPAPGALAVRWVGDELFLVRDVAGSSRIRAQAVWLDWPELRAWLLARVTDLLPQATLEPVPAEAPFAAEDASRRLAFLPVRLQPGPVSPPAASSWTPLQVSLAIAWCLAGVGVLALGLLLAGTLRLSERRAAFVSAVTHELRTPLTTFRMYTEMLAGGMVPDETRRRGYMDTLRKEAERLSHLVENVLSYARLERGRASRRVEETTPGDLFARIEERLRLRAEQGGLSLQVTFEPQAERLPLHTDTTAFEQIVFNLVDNAAKYARRPEGGTLAILVGPGDRRRVTVRVVDRGPGIPAAVRKRLFRPFSKSATEAAHSQPGVGLGLALSRRLARDELHGELTLERSGPEGTVFRLEV